MEKFGHMEVDLMIVFLGVDAHNLPGRTPDFSSLDYCEWRWMKEMAYTMKAGI